MAKVPSHEVFNLDWSNLPEVIQLAKKLGPGQSVIRYTGRRYYNITHTEREKTIRKPFTVLFRTGDENG